MIEADNASTSIYQVIRMSRAAKTQLLILKRSYKEGRGHPYYTSGDVPTRCPAEFLSLSIMLKWMTVANNASNVITEVKMAIILPTGQWYAPSAVINDAWYWLVLHVAKR